MPKKSTPHTPAGWQSQPVTIQIQNAQERVFIEFPNLAALMAWLARQELTP